MAGKRKLFSSYKAYNGGNVIFDSNLHGNIIGKGTDLLIPSGTDLLTPSGTDLLTPSGTDLLIPLKTDLLGIKRNSADSYAYRVYIRRTKKIMETMNVTFNELSAMAFKQSSSIITTQKPTKRELDLLFEAMHDDYIGGQPSAAPRTTPATQAPQDVDELETQQQQAQQQENQAPLQPETVADNVLNAMFDENTFVNPFATPPTSAAESSSSQYVDPSNMHTNQLRSDGDMCMYALMVSTMESKNVKEAMTDPAWIDSMQEELLQFKRLDV
ncbi:hypothetical protein Tco_1443350 [Tanacetum coccineum]